MTFIRTGIIILTIISFQNSLVDTTNKKSYLNNYENKVENLSSRIDSLEIVLSNKQSLSNLYSSEITFHNAIFTALLAIILALFGWGGWKRIDNKYNEIKNHTDTKLQASYSAVERTIKDIRNLKLEIYHNLEEFYFETALNNKTKNIGEVSVRHFLMSSMYVRKQMLLLKDSSNNSKIYADTFIRINLYLNQLDETIKDLKEKGKVHKVKVYYNDEVEKILKNLMDVREEGINEKAKSIFVEIENIIE